MATLTTAGAAVVFLLLCGSSTIVRSQAGVDKIEMQCDPSVSSRFQQCPDGYCCVRDEFLPTWVYCVKVGLLNEDCTTQESETNCPCGAGLYCRPNVISHSVASFYGQCVPDTSSTSS